MRPNDHVDSKQGCPKCVKRQIYTKDYYLAKNIENHPVWLYLVSFKNENEEFVKIGFTKHENIRYRFRGYRSKYSIEIIDKKQLMFFDAFEIEQNLLKIFKDFSYKPLIKFKGHTETIEYNQKQKLMSALTEMLSTTSF